MCRSTQHNPTDHRPPRRHLHSPLPSHHIIVHPLPTLPGVGRIVVGRRGRLVGGHRGCTTMGVRPVGIRVIAAWTGMSRNGVVTT